MTELSIGISMMTVFALIFGFYWGKRYGRYHGYQEGKTEAILILRQQSLEQGYCVLCNENRSTTTIDRITLFTATNNIRKERDDCGDIENGTQKTSYPGKS